MKPYSPLRSESMRCFYNSLNEKDRRRYVGVEALKFGHGGRVYIYETGRKVSAEFKNTIRIVFDNIDPTWNYCAIPIDEANAQVI